MKSAEVRQQFIQFFNDKEHAFISPSPVVPESDPTLLFINAGMNQFKPYFLDLETPDVRRAVNSQPCIRVSGKHNDLDDVGHDGHHHTLFEMLGNWSFGDFYKKETIQWAWTLLTEVYKFPKAHLYVSVFEDDDETESLWKSETDIDHQHIIRCGKKDNFWEMGETGPCGPCSEVHLDCQPELPTQPVERDHETGGFSERYMELWNLVFIQYNRQADGSLEDLPEKHVDTGAGLERITTALQGVSSNYETDLFSGIIERIAELTGKAYDAGEAGTPHRVMADHIRTLCFAISDNVRPSNEGRGYVLRRILRRALSYANQLGCSEPILHKLVPSVVAIMGAAYPNIASREDYISSMIQSEELAFLRTLESGLDTFNRFITRIKSEEKSILSGEDAFMLYDTFGFPIDLTQLKAREHNLNVDLDVFHTLLEEQKNRSRDARSQKKGDDSDAPDIAFFTGEALDVHPGIYTHSPGGGEARVPETGTQRFLMAQHHSATHLLHLALRQTLGDHVTQAGSLVDYDRLRFDYTHPNALTPDQLKAVQAIIDAAISQSIPVQVSENAIDEAKAMGAMALFGEKYGDQVRVVQMGPDSIELCGGNHVQSTADIQAFILVSDSAIAAGTRRIEAIVGHDNIARYQKQIMDEISRELDQKLKQLDTLLDGDPLDPPLPFDRSNLSNMGHEALHDALQLTIKRIKSTQKQQAARTHQQAGESIAALRQELIALPNENARILVKEFTNNDLSMLRSMSDHLLGCESDIVLIFASHVNDKGLFFVRLSSTLQEKLNATELIKSLTAIAGGGGGGRADMAQAGGADVSKLSDALTQIKHQMLSQ